MSNAMHHDNTQSGASNGVALGLVVSVVQRSPGMTASGIGAELWGNARMGDLIGARYARPAAKLLNRAKKEHLVYSLQDGPIRRWYPHANNSDEPIPATNNQPKGH
tara:strand:+ start:3580 stop:3897 length:318 start_codon:yes stop_codon:yes gene_type:complete